MSGAAKMTIAQLKAALTEAGVELPGAGARKADYVALYEASVAGKSGDDGQRAPAASVAAAKPAGEAPPPAASPAAAASAGPATDGPAAAANSDGATPAGNGASGGLKTAPTAGMTEPEKLAARAKRFGLSSGAQALKPNDEEAVKKAQRAKRFGLAPGTASKTATSKLDARAARIEKALNQGLRAGNAKILKRKGEPISRPLKGMSEEELARMKKRAERFGLSTTGAVATAEEEAKRARRAERFGAK